MKANPDREGEQRTQQQRRRAMDELLHDLSQPLTSLHCQLEIALRKPRPNDEYRDCLARALEQAEAAARVTDKLREFNAACDTAERD